MSSNQDPVWHCAEYGAVIRHMHSPTVCGISEIVFMASLLVLLKILVVPPDPPTRPLAMIIPSFLSFSCSFS